MNNKAIIKKKEVEAEQLQVQGQPGERKLVRSYLKNKIQNKRARGMAQEVECSPHMSEALDEISITEKEREGEGETQRQRKKKTKGARMPIPILRSFPMTYFPPMRPHF
jgi:hypothetical protein